MNSKIKIIVISMSVIICIIFIILTFYKFNNNEIIDDINNKVQVKQDDSTGEYIIYNEYEEILKRINEEASIQVYIDNPDYDPKIQYEDMHINLEEDL